MKKVQNQYGNVLDSNYFLFPALGLPIYIWLGSDLIQSFQSKGMYEYLFLLIGLLALLFCAWISLMCCYRFRIDETGVTVQRLFGQRCFAWEDIRDITITSRTTSDRHVECVIFSKEQLHLPIKPEPESIDIGKKKLSLCVDLDSKEYPADKLYAFINKQQFLQFADSQGLVLHHDAVALKSMKRRKRWKATK